MVDVLERLGISTAMQTLPSDILDVTIEAAAENSTGDVVSDPTDMVQTEATLEAQSILQDSLERLEAIEGGSLRAASSNSVCFTDRDFIYVVKFNNTQYSVLFPENMREYLVERDGYLINTYGSSVTGLILDNGDSAAIDSYHSQYLTLYPFTNTSGNSAAYNYGAYSYVTTYRPNSYNNGLTSSTVYGNTTVVQNPGLFRGFTDFQLIMIFAAGLLVLIQFFGGIFRR